jgi:hypothetical protein
MTNLESIQNQAKEISNMTDKFMASAIQYVQCSYDIDFSEHYCHSDCETDEGCPHEYECIIKWLNEEK